MAVARHGGLVGARWHEHGESVTVTGPLQYTDSAMSFLGVFRSAKSSKKITSDTVVYCNIFCLFMINIVLP